MKPFQIVTLLILFAMISCTSPKNQVDLIVHHAQVYTVSDSIPIAEAFAIKDGKFVAVGTNSEILGKYSADTILNLKGKFVYPGLIDAHCHFYGYGLSLQWTDLSETKSFVEVISRLKSHQQKLQTNWILGHGWDQNNWAVKEFPDKSELDLAFPDKPVLLTRIDGHAVVVNSFALKIAKITASTKINGGEIILKNGEPTGVLVDNAAEYIKTLIPQPTFADQTKALLKAQQNCFEVGLTSVSDAGLPPKIIGIIDQLQKAKQMKIRVYAMLETTLTEEKEFMQKNGFLKTDFLSVRSIKLYADGALGSRGALMLTPYSDKPDFYGLAVNSISDLKKFAEQALEFDYQVNTHCIGDSANRAVLKMYGSLLKTANDKRWRIEHAQVIDAADFDLFRQFSVVPSVQPTHATSDMDWAMDRLGEKRVKNAYAYKRLMHQLGWLPCGSDFPVENINPLYGFYAAVVRKDQKGKPEKGYQIENALTREEALKGMTIWAAKANFEEKEKGSIEAEKFADFIITNQDLMTSPDDQLFKIKVIETFVGGEKVH